MSIEALILGKLYQRAEQRTGKAGRPFVTAKCVFQRSWTPVSV